MFVNGNEYILKMEMKITTQHSITFGKWLHMDQDRCTSKTTTITHSYNI